MESSQPEINESSGSVRDGRVLKATERKVSTEGAAFLDAQCRFLNLLTITRVGGNGAVRLAMAESGIQE